MPVDTTIIPFRYPKNGEKGNERLITNAGNVVSAIQCATTEAEGNGYVSHFANCPKAAGHRKKQGG